MFSTPVVFIVFNRADTTAKVFEVIRKMQPEKLYVIADGPRSEEEKTRTKATRKVIENIDWPCTVVRIYSEVNLGCRQRVISGLNEVFSQTEEAIILEDDCLPDPSFFTFCETLLNRYRKDVSVMHIGGNNFQFGRVVGDGDYYFSSYAHIWGWATWRRAWQQFQPKLKDIKAFKEGSLMAYCNGEEDQMTYWKNILETIERPGYTAWSYHWLFTVWQHSGKAIIPNKNLVCNIGFEGSFTHTKSKPSWYEDVHLNELKTYQSPDEEGINFQADTFSFFKIFQAWPKEYSYFQRLKISIKRKLKTVLFESKS